MGLSSDVSQFGSKFWKGRIRELGYPFEVVELDLSALKGQKALRALGRC